MNSMGKSTRWLSILLIAGGLASCGDGSRKDAKEQVKYETQVMEPESRVYNIYIFPLRCMA